MSKTLFLQIKKTNFSYREHIKNYSRKLTFDIENTLQIIQKHHLFKKETKLIHYLGVCKYFNKLLKLTVDFKEVHKIYIIN